jgi:hypothetical protein
MTVREAKPPRDQPVLSAIAVGATLLVLPVLLLAGDFRVVTLPGLLLALALVAAGRDTLHTLLALAMIAVLWVASRPDPLTPWSLVFATLMVTIHSAVALKSSLPPGAVPDRRIALRWLLRGAVVIALAAVVYLVGIAVHHQHRGKSEVVVVLALALLGALVLLLRDETVQDAPP